MANIQEDLLEICREVLDGPMSLDKAILIAVLGHAGQKDKGGNSYIRHPLRVMEQMDSEDEMCVAVLHDTPEDTDVGLKELIELGLPDYSVRDVDALTKRHGEQYSDSMQRVLLRRVARKVKEKDIRDNMALWRLKNKKLTERDMARMQNYIDALVLLGRIDEK